MAGPKSRHKFATDAIGAPMEENKMRFLINTAVAATVMITMPFVTPSQAQVFGQHSADAELAALQREKSQLLDVIQAYWRDSPTSTTCAMIGLGTAGAMILEQVDTQFRRDLSDNVRGGLAAGAVFCTVYCSFNSEATCGAATVFVTRVGYRLTAIASREQALQHRIPTR